MLIIELNNYTIIQVYARLNHVGVALSYTGTLKVVSDISSMHEAPLKKWISSGLPIKFIGDNVDKRKDVRDIRSNHHHSLVHMYSLLVIRPRAYDSSLSTTGSTENLHKLDASSFLPTAEEINAIKMNLTVLAGRILCAYIKCLNQCAEVVPQHIPHQYSDSMAEKSDTYFLDVLTKNEARHADMVEIMQAMQGYLGEDFPCDKRVLSGGDQLTCERQACAQRHLMDGDTPRERLQLVEPITEDWHALMCFLKVTQS